MLKKAEGDEQIAADALLNDTQPLELSQDVMDLMYDRKDDKEVVEEVEEEEGTTNHNTYNKHNNTLSYSDVAYSLNYLPGFPPKANAGAIGIHQLVQVGTHHFQHAHTPNTTHSQHT